ncbi:hypothetical protein [Rhodococcus gannanensis]|uniref:Tetratricopeptide repeat protein n=1 Tax=Rhodococcus gannanensis TaxID=1960308 RepID=A0ABW4P484_9NOCA
MTTTAALELGDIRRMPYGVARIAAAEAVTRRVEAEGPRDLLAEALLDLVEAYTYAGEGAKSFVVFARALRLWDESPELFDDQDEHNLFWEFKWVASDLPHYPQITAEQGAAFLEDMERRYRLVGHGLSAVRMSRFRWDWHTGRPDAEDTRLAWIAQARDEFDDCRACTIGQQVLYFAETGRHAEAVALGLTQDDSCNLEPTITHHAVALSALLAGDPELALDQHRRALASLDTSNRELAPSRGQAFEMLARGGHLERALRVLRNDDVVLLDHAPTPLKRLYFLVGVLAGLSANLDHADTVTGLREPERRTVAALHAWVRAQADELAARFDTRNGNRYFTHLIARALTATRTDRPLDFESTGTTAASAAPSGVVSAAADAGADDSGDDRFARAETLASRRDHQAARAEYNAAAVRFEADGLLDRAGLAYAEAAQCAAETGDEDAAHEMFGAAVPRLVAGGAPDDIVAAVLTAWAPLAVRMDAIGELLPTLAASLARIERPLDTTDLTEDLAERRRAEHGRTVATVRDTLARTLAGAPTSQIPADLEAVNPADEALRAGEEFARLGLVVDAAHAFWLAGRVQRAVGVTDAALWALESAFEGFTASGHAAGRAEVAGELIELLRASGQTDRADQITAQLTR